MSSLRDSVYEDRRKRPSKQPSKGGPGYKIWHFAVPEAVVEAVAQLAQEERRTVPQQVIFMVQEGLRRRAEHLRRAEDEARRSA